MRQKQSGSEWQHTEYPAAIFKQSSKTQYLVDLVTLVSLMAQSSYIWIRALVVVTILLFLVNLADQIDPFGHRDHSAPMQVQSQLQSQHSFPSTDQIDPFGHRDHSAPMQVQSQLQSQHSFPSTPPSSPSTSTPPSSPSTADASVVRDCEHLFEEDNCDFKVEQGRKFDCKMEQLSRFVFTLWLRPGAKVLEVGARYGHSSCQLAKVVGLTGTHGDAQGAKQVSVDADPLVWGILEKNLADHECDVQVVRGTIGSKSYKLVSPQANSGTKGKEQYGSFVADLNDSHHGTVIPAHSVRSLNLNFDTLAIDCEGCFATFLDENPELLESLTMIILELHDLQRLTWMLQRPDRVTSSEDQSVANLLKNGWELKHSIGDHRVLCKGPCVNFCDSEWVERQRKRYKWKVVNPK